MYESAAPEQNFQCRELKQLGPHSMTVSMFIMYALFAAFNLAVFAIMKHSAAIPECISTASLWHTQGVTWLVHWHGCILWALTCSFVHPDDPQAALPHNFALGNQKANHRRGAPGGREVA